MQLKPDLIVADITMQKDLYPLLKQIAPTIMLNGLLGDLDTQIKNTEILAKATNTLNKIPNLTKELKDQYRKAKQDGAKHKNTVIIGFISSAGKFQALTANALTSEILKDFSHPNLIKVSRKEQATFIPIETLVAMNPSNIIILLTNGDTRPYSKYIKKPLWYKLNAVKTKKIYFMDRDIWAKNHGLLATKLLIDEAYETGFISNKPNNELTF